MVSKNYFFIKISVLCLKGCAYNNPPCEEGYECINNVCVLIEECTESWQCSEWSECVDSQQTRTCIDENECGTTENKPEEIQSCIVETKKVIFRTNVVDGNYGSRDDEIAFDSDGDGDLDCFKYYSYYSSYNPKDPVVLGKTVEGYDIHEYHRKRVIIYHDRNYIYGSRNSCSIPLTTEPTEPYATNGQELYE